MKIEEGKIPGLLIIEPETFGDDRGFFFECWNKELFAAAGIDHDFVQDNHSRSRKGVLRGLHFQNPAPQGKLVRVVAGAIWDVAVDVRRSSSAFGHWTAIKLSAENKKILWIPPGFAHGFLTLVDDTDVLYKCTTPFAPEHEQSLLWNDPHVAITWPLNGMEPLLSDKDRYGLELSQLATFL